MSALSFAAQLAAAHVAEAVAETSRRFARPVRIPAIGDFAQIAREIGQADVGWAEFDAAMNAHAADVPCPRISSMTYAGEILSESFIPAHIELTDAQINAQAAMALEFSDTFRNHFARYYLNSIVRDVRAKRS